MNSRRWIDVVAGPSIDLPPSELDAENIHSPESKTTPTTEQTHFSHPSCTDPLYQPSPSPQDTYPSYYQRRQSSDATSSVSRHSIQSPSKPSSHPKLSKRQRQSEASRRFRMRKEEMLHSLKAEVDEREKEKFDLSVKIAVLENERDAWEKREKELIDLIESLKR